VEKHVQLLGILWLCLGGLMLFLGILTFIFFLGLSFLPEVEVESSIILRLLSFLVGGVILLFSLPKLVAGYGLLKHLEWGRILTLVLSFFSLLNFPLGTALAIYSFVILTKPETVQLFNPQ